MSVVKNSLLEKTGYDCEILDVVFNVYTTTQIKFEV